MKAVNIRILIGDGKGETILQEATTFSEETTKEIAEWKIKEMFEMLEQKDPHCWMHIAIDSLNTEKPSTNEGQRLTTE